MFKVLLHNAAYTQGVRMMQPLVRESDDADLRRPLKPHLNPAGLRNASEKVQLNSETHTKTPTVPPFICFFLRRFMCTPRYYNATLPLPYLLAFFLIFSRFVVSWHTKTEKLRASQASLEAERPALRKAAESEEVRAHMEHALFFCIFFTYIFFWNKGNNFTCDVPYVIVTKLKLRRACGFPWWCWFDSPADPTWSVKAKNAPGWTDLCLQQFVQSSFFQSSISIDGSHQDRWRTERKKSVSCIVCLAFV